MHRQVDVSPGSFDIVMTLGTDHHPFGRAIDWLRRWRQGPGAGTRVFLQHGYTQAQPLTAHRQTEFVGPGELDELLGRARVAVCHGGPGTVFQCRAQGIIPVVMPRSGVAGEHVDDHQQLFTQRLSEASLIDRVETYPMFESAMTAALARPRATLETIDEAAVRVSVNRLEALITAAVYDGPPASDVEAP